MTNAQSSVETRLELLSKPTGTWGTREVAEYFGVSKSKAFNVIKDLPAPPASMFDINKTLMRCLVKNLAMFGLGLYIYAGEDLPEDTDNLPTPQENEPTGSNRQAIPDFTLEGEILSREEMKFYYSYQVLEPVKAIIANTLGDKKLGDLTEVEQRKLTIEAREKYREIKGGK